MIQALKEFNHVGLHKKYMENILKHHRGTNNPLHNLQKEKRNGEICFQKFSEKNEENTCQNYILRPDGLFQTEKMFIHSAIHSIPCQHNIIYVSQ